MICVTHPYSVCISPASLSTRTSINRSFGGSKLPVKSISVHWPLQINDVRATPDELFKLIGSRLMICEQAALVASHGEMVDQEGARCRLVGIGIERALEGLEEVGNIAV
ncbi:hypothetical protein VPNG_00242 [Cytospora leucostoma]|uniref:Uncharacterized protein n=1 Tax=Cytospora leucostoma TaxID=1230097 RepID=A0A423XNK0_9PEZI|nr:hypothetical protein VPNG_00242 [Cytospora leucostoma]